ncbi:MAG: hypothetical protein HOO96_40885 [Polyangiaceae bacterium]|nr:hypothetical protein [Polyangiaceae bacterium]
MLLARPLRLVVTVLSLAALGGCTWSTVPEPAPKQAEPAVDTNVPGAQVNPQRADDDVEANSEKIKK